MRCDSEQIRRYEVYSAVIGGWVEVNVGGDPFPRNTAPKQRHLISLTLVKYNDLKPIYTSLGSALQFGALINKSSRR